MNSEEDRTRQQCVKIECLIVEARAKAIVNQDHKQLHIIGKLYTDLNVIRRKESITISAINGGTLTDEELDRAHHRLSQYAKQTLKLLVWNNIKGITHE